MEALSFIKSKISWVVDNGESILVLESPLDSWAKGFRKPLPDISNTDIYIKDLSNSHKVWDFPRVRSLFSFQ